MSWETALSGKANLLVTFSLTDSKWSAQSFGIQATRQPIAMAILRLKP
jgi:hypothetical protein